MKWRAKHPVFNPHLVKLVTRNPKPASRLPEPLLKSIFGRSSSPLLAGRSHVPLWALLHRRHRRYVILSIDFSDFFVYGKNSICRHGWI